MESYDGASKIVLDMNGHGDIVYAVTESGAKQFSGTYDAWGVIEDSYGSGTNPIGYAGEYYDYESGMTYLRRDTMTSI